MATIIMIAKFVLSLKIDPSTWLMVNSIQMVWSFALLHAPMPNNLRVFLMKGIISFNFDTNPEFIQKIIPSFKFKIPSVTNYLPVGELDLYKSFGIRSSFFLIVLAEKLITFIPFVILYCVLGLIIKVVSFFFKQKFIIS